MKIEFINHASFLIEHQGVSVVCDPWLFGSAFLDGWDLLCPTNFPVERFKDVQYIWFSHEHPDHFSPIVIKSIPEEIRKNITVLFHYTKDKKVIDFCAKAGFKTMELESCKEYSLASDFKIKCDAVLPFDSWICFMGDGKKIMNVNDCIVDGEAKAEDLKKHTGEVDVLFTQFSYAAWKGNEGDIQLRKDSAASKLKIVQDQIHVFKPKYTIPFASFVYFSHEENKYTNNGVNLPITACNAIESAGSTPILLYPNDVWEVGTNWDNTAPNQKYEKQYADLPNKPYHKAKKSYSESELIAACDKYLKRLREKNNFTLVSLIKLVPGFGFFKPFTILVHDLNTVFRFDISKGLEKMPNGTSYDVRMHSESLEYVFRLDWGYDTLTVNGRFNADMQGFSRMTKNFSVGPLNNTGRYISVKLFFDFEMIGNFLTAMYRFGKRMKKNKVEMTKTIG